MNLGDVIWGFSVGWFREVFVKCVFGSFVVLVWWCGVDYLFYVVVDDDIFFKRNICVIDEWW